MDDAIQKNILHELKIIKRVLVYNLVAGARQSEQIDKLNSVGFQQKEIADILGTTRNTVNVALNRLKKSRQKKVSKDTQK